MTSWPWLPTVNDNTLCAHCYCRKMYNYLETYIDKKLLWFDLLFYLQGK